MQHAEHYFRLIAAAQAAQALAQSGQPRPPGEGEGDDLDEDSDFGGPSDRFASPSERSGGYYQQQPYGPPAQPSAAPNAPQPYIERAPFDPDRQGPKDRNGFPNRQDRPGNRFPDRGSRPDRPFGERNEGYRDNRHSRDGRPREFRPYRDPSSQSAREGGAESAESVESTGLPSFITAGSRANAAEASDAQPMPVADAPAPTGAPDTSLLSRESPPAEGRFPGRGRRRRLRSPYGFNDANPGDSDPQSSDPMVSDEPPVRE